jgi:hypothetical protein
MIVQMTLDAPAQLGTVAKRGIVPQCSSVLGKLPKILDLEFHLVCVGRLGATNAKGVGRERRGNLRGGCMSKLCVE